MGWEGFATALLQPGKVHSEHRSHILKAFSSSSIASYDALIQKSIEQQILARLASRSEDPENIITRYACHPSEPLHAIVLLVLIPLLSAIASTLVGITYGDALSEEEQNELHHVQKTLIQAGFEVENQLINFLLDIIPSRVSSHAAISRGRTV
jgi:hypothetical protein